MTFKEDLIERLKELDNNSKIDIFITYFIRQNYIEKQKVKNALAKECDCNEDYICSACRIGKELFGD